MRILICLFLFNISGQVLGQESVIEDLRTEVSAMEEGSKLLLEYTFSGCYGPYHHGTIAMTLVGGALEYLSSSFDDKNQPGIAQAGSYTIKQLERLLRKAASHSSSKIYGNAITYRLSSRGEEILVGADHIEQRHFIEIFQPFTSIFPKDAPDIIPKVSSGGFVH